MSDRAPVRLRGDRHDEGIRPRLLLIGVNHRTSPLNERERLVRRVTYEALGEAAGREPPWEDVVLLSTCNRVEVYTFTRHTRRTEAAIRHAFDLPIDSRSLYRLEDFEAAAHLFRVASGLESVAQGERQVADQVRDAPARRPESWSTNHGLDGLFFRAARSAARIRALAELDDPSASASQAAVRFVREIVKTPRPSIALIGSGKMARIVARSLQGHAKIVVDRTPAKAVAVATRLGGRVVGLQDIEEVLTEADVVLAATSVQRPLVSARALRGIMRRRSGRPLWIVDLGVPRNIDPKARYISGVTYVDIDGLGPWGSRPPGPMALARAEARIHHEARDFLASLVGGQEDAVAALRKAVEGFRIAELERALARLPDPTHRERAVLEKLTTRLVNRILHGPTQQLRDIAEGQREAFVRSLLESWPDLGSDRS